MNTRILTIAMIVAGGIAKLTARLRFFDTSQQRCW